MHKNKLLGVAATCCLVFNFSTKAQVRLPQLVGDHMVLQRNAKVNIWGWASPAEKVTVKFQGKTYRVTTGNNGDWKVVLPAMKPGGPYTMNITGTNHINMQDIMVGDVWFCSGQSNMVVPMERVKEKFPDEIEKANYPQIRNFFIPTVSDVAKVHQDLPPGKWEPTNPQTVLNFGAASYFFAKQLYTKYHVPIGVINSSVGGTPIQAWISEDGIKEIPQYSSRLSQLKDTAYLNPILRRASMRRHSGVAPHETDLGLIGAKPWYATDYTPVGWHSFWLPGYWADQGIRGLNGVVWFRKEIDLPAGMGGKAAKLFMGRIVDADRTYVNGVEVGNITYQYPPRRYKVPENLLKAGKNVIVVRIVNTAGKGGFVPDKPYFLECNGEKIDLRGQWQYKVGQAYQPRGNFEGFYPFSAQNEPTGLYNTMVAPAIPYTIKGFVWYQGEANTGKPQEYEQLLKTLITDWRNKWHEGELPFLYAQLPNFMEVQYSPSESQWAELRENQRKALSVPNTAMAVTIDLGEWNDIHPLNKKDVGERLALLAEKIAYGNKSIVASGPVCESAKADGSKIILKFTNADDGLVSRGNDGISGFAIAGADKKFVWANVSIQGDQVIVWSDSITKPVYIRYAWADNPANMDLLYNKEGLPTSPFEINLEQQ
jgi:sialate O-acetylesterase